MNFKRYLLVGALSAGMLTGCGGSDDGTTFGTLYTGNTVDAEVSDEAKEGLAIEMQAAVKAVTFVRYEEDILNYEVKHTAPMEFAVLLQEMLGEVSKELQNFFGLGTIPATPFEGSCANGGSASISGTAFNLSVVANNYCESANSTEVTLSGGYEFTLDGENFSIKLNETTTTIDAINTINVIKANGSIVYSSTELQNVLVVDTSLNFDGILASSQLTQTCTAEGCEVDANIVGDNGTTYRAEDLIVTTSTYGYRGSADFFLPQLGKVSAEFYNIQYCEDSSIRSGYIFISDSTGPAEIHIRFTDCGVAVPEFYEQGAPK